MAIIIAGFPKNYNSIFHDFNNWKKNSKKMSKGALPPCAPCLVRFASLGDPPTPNTFRPPLRNGLVAPLGLVQPIKLFAVHKVRAVRFQMYFRLKKSCPRNRCSILSTCLPKYCLKIDVLFYLHVCLNTA